MEFDDDELRCIAVSYVLYTTIGAALCDIVIWQARGASAKLSYFQAILLITTLTLVLAGGVLTVLDFWVREPNFFETLNVNLHSLLSDVRRNYLLKSAHIRSNFPVDQQQSHIDELQLAYETFFDAESRKKYFFGGRKAVLYKHLSDFYYTLPTIVYFFVWTPTIFALTSSQRKRNARSWSVTGLIVIFAFEFAMRVYDWDPSQGYFPQSTPDDFLRIIKMLYPSLVLGLSAYYSLFYIDEDFFRCQLLKEAGSNNEAAMEVLDKLGYLSEDYRRDLEVRSEKEVSFDPDEGFAFVQPQLYEQEDTKTK